MDEIKLIIERTDPVKITVDRYSLTIEFSDGARLYATPEGGMGHNEGASWMNWTWDIGQPPNTVKADS